MNIIIIGNGVAGISTAKKLRELHPDRDLVIELFTKEAFPYYSRIRLPEIIEGHTEPAAIQFLPDKWYSDNVITVHLKTTVSSIDVANKSALDSNGIRHQYDQLLFASGSQSMVPVVEGSKGEGIFTLRTMADAIAIREKKKNWHKVAIIGGGLLGLELGNALIHSGLEVIIIEYAGRLLPRQTDIEGGVILQRELEKLGFQFVLGASVNKIADTAQGKIIYYGDKTVDASAVFFSAGIKPDIELAQTTGIKCEKGILVDEYLRTNLPDIWAVGDCIQWQGRIYGLWSSAQEQGAIVAENMLGTSKTYQPTPPATSLKVAGIALTAIGTLEGEGITAVTEETAALYQKIFIRDNQLVGGILIGGSSVQTAELKKRFTTH